MSFFVLMTVNLANLPIVEFCSGETDIDGFKKSMPQVNNLSARSLQYYVIAKKWAQDLEFFKFELSFLRKLISDTVVNNVDPAEIQLGRLRENLLKLEFDNGEAFVQLEGQSTHLELMAEDIIPENVDALACKQVELEYLMATLTADFRAIKKEIYVLISSMMAKNKVRYN